MRKRRDYHDDNVLGDSDQKEVAGAFDENFKVKVHSYIDGRDF